MPLPHRGTNSPGNICHHIFGNRSRRRFFCNYIHVILKKPVINSTVIATTIIQCRPRCIGVNLLLSILSFILIVFILDLKMLLARKLSSKRLVPTYQFVFCLRSVTGSPELSKGQIPSIGRNPNFVNCLLPIRNS